MILLWNIHVFNQETKEHSEKWLRLDTQTLAPVMRHRLELCIDRSNHFSRELLDYRHLFQEQLASATDGWKSDDNSDYPKIVSIHNYFENETEREIGPSEIVRIVTGNSDLIVVPPGMRPHDVTLHYLTDNTPLPPNAIDQIHLTQEEVDTLAYFLRDSTELKVERFYKNPPSFHSQGPKQWLESIPVENIRSFVIVFRRMYMDKEPGNYIKACDVYLQHFLNKRITNWVSAEKQLYERFLSASASFFPGMNPQWSFDNKCLVDIFLYTQFVHQPQKKRIMQFAECQKEVGNVDQMEYACYNAMFEMAHYYSRLHWIVSNELPGYLKHRNERPSFNSPPFVNEGARGAQLTKEEREAEQFDARAKILGYELWEAAGKRNGELVKYVEEAVLSLRGQPEPQ